MTAAAQQQLPPGVYAFGPDQTFSQIAETKEILFKRDETKLAGEALAEVLARLQRETWRDGTTFEFIFKDHKVGCVRAVVPSRGPKVRFAATEGLCGLLAQMCEHGFGTTKLNLSRSHEHTWRHELTAFTLRNPADLALLDREVTDQIEVGERAIRLFRTTWTRFQQLLGM
ncbi:MAG TPA: hypothetical protein VFS21_38400 [Roseiflexaceae bacterium]|nr:hypothetical protein [Roseiflexaceae bacterium]